MGNYLCRKTENDDVTSTTSVAPFETTMNTSIEKVQQWLDAYEDDILFTSSVSTSSTTPTHLIADDDEHDDAAVSDNAANVISSSNSSSDDDMEVPVNNIDIIYNRTEAMLNQHTFYAAVDAACVRYACDEVVRILDLSKDEYYVPSSGLTLRILRWIVIA